MKGSSIICRAVTMDMTAAATGSYSFTATTVLTSP